MSKISLAPDASGTGIFTIASPGTSTNRTLTLPDDTGTLALTSAALTGTTDSGTPFETALGSGAGAVNTGVNNTFVGFEAGNDNTSGTNNTALGFSSLDVNITGANNTALGSNALGANTVSNNTGIGYNALAVNTTGLENVAVGYQALDANTTGGGNTAVGFNALTTSTTGVRNTAVGAYALQANTTGSDNAAFGAHLSNSWAPLFSNTTGSNNAAFGSGALPKNTIASNNTAIGVGSLFENTTGSSNTAVGRQALEANTTGLQNTAVGHTAGDVITTGSQNICIGFATDPSANNGLGQITIGYGLSGQGNYHVTMGTSSSKIYVNYTSTGTWTQTSDETLKNVIGEDSLGLSFINRLNPVTFTWKPQDELSVDHPHYSPTNKKDTSVVMHGLLAQDVKAAMDAEGCTTFNGWDQGPDGVQAVSREMFVTPLINAIKELSAQVTALQAEVNTLKGN